MPWTEILAKVKFSTDKTVKDFLYKRMYEHWKLNRSHSKARRVVVDLFELLFTEPNCLPSPWREKAERGSIQAKARVVADYIAGMTDRYALDFLRKAGTEELGRGRGSRGTGPVQQLPHDQQRGLNSEAIAFGSLHPRGDSFS